MNGSPLQIATQALREWLLFKLSAKTSEVNAQRRARLTAQFAGPYAVVGNLSFSSSRGGPWETPTLTTGTRTALQVATELNNEFSEMEAGVDDFGRLYVLSGNTPSESDDQASCIALKAAATANEPFGWPAAGDYELNTPIRTPTFNGICDGNPLYPFDNSQGFWVVIDDRECVLWPSTETHRRRDEYLCTFQIYIYRPDIGAQSHRSREGIASCVRCVREVLSTASGLQLGRAEFGDIVIVNIASEKISGTPFSFSNSKTPNLAFDVAHMVVQIKVFQLPPTDGGGN